MCVPWKYGDFHESVSKRKVARSEAVKPLYRSENEEFLNDLVRKNNKKDKKFGSCQIDLKLISSQTRLNKTFF